MGDPVITDEALLDQIRDFHRVHGRPPEQTDFGHSNGLASVTTLKRRFGGVKQARALAGVPEPGKKTRPPAESAPTPEQIEAKIHEWMNTHDGKPPVVVDWQKPKHRRGDFPNYDQVVKVCGSWRETIAAAAKTWAFIDPEPAVATPAPLPQELAAVRDAAVEVAADEFLPAIPVLRSSEVIQPVPDVVVALARIEGIATYADTYRRDDVINRIRLIAREALDLTQTGRKP
jgi:hypothetical protein